MIQNDSLRGFKRFKQCRRDTIYLGMCMKMGGDRAIPQFMVLIHCENDDDNALGLGSSHCHC
jgi:hypothetical protein